MVIVKLYNQIKDCLPQIYAGNLASIMAESMELLLSERAENLSGSFFYCMDETMSMKFSEVKNGGQK